MRRPLRPSEHSSHCFTCSPARGLLYHLQPARGLHCVLQGARGLPCLPCHPVKAAGLLLSNMDNSCLPSIGFFLYLGIGHFRESSPVETRDLLEKSACPTTQSPPVEQELNHLHHSGPRHGLCQAQTSRTTAAPHRTRPLHNARTANRTCFGDSGSAAWRTLLGLGFADKTGTELMRAWAESPSGDGCLFSSH